MSRYEAERWGLERSTYDDSTNVIVMCEGCNTRIGWHSPPLHLGLRYLLKPWIETNHNDTKEHER
ncbi:hypothetical protein KIH27_15980 [Mycobacterium sp. M1]|uniref:Protein yippee-like n=1 Tax=Mycolicibacter acidiphilus TaxID=2835306 RepID=A0ABS5RLB7_9MYCO|nr:hypothetical protein [Mycolicibacter acidiphilus]